MAAAKPACSVPASSADAAKPPAAPEQQQQLLEVAEEEVVVDFKPSSKCRVDLRLRSLHPTLPVAFKVQTSSPLKFLVSPPRGALQPLSSATIRVVLRPQPHAPPSFPRSRADRFLVLSSLSAAHLDSAASVPGGAIRLRVFFGGPYLLRLAADAGDSAAVRLILRRQPHLLPVLDPEAAVPEAEQWAPLHAAAARGDCGEVRRLGQEALAVRDKDGRTALHVAAAAGEAEAVAELVDMGADSAAADARGRTPLDVAREKGYKEVVDVLQRWELVMTAARRGDLRSLELLLAKRTGLRGRDQYGLTALHVAAIKGHCDAIALLAGSGCMDVECEDVEGHRPLHLAVEGGCADAVDLLLDMGADVHARTKRGATPLHMADTMGYDDISQLLRGRGADEAAAAADAQLCIASSSSSSISCA
ncbi:protein VAPYRIN-like [Hordeum vulgare subsp. vulgare]|uniref:MSP domain-containing protein n=1 Tax=Hordeum vulgare subsp. vulgare TaxID=112509 RepID=A0A8I6X3Y7_HORVV|nr:protein VAPYRIN-like [Hordeum vulgare subsp. vulgare]